MMSCRAATGSHVEARCLRQSAIDWILFPGGKGDVDGSGYAARGRFVVPSPEPTGRPTICRVPALLWAGLLVAIGDGSGTHAGAQWRPVSSSRLVAESAHLTDGGPGAGLLQVQASLSASSIRISSV